MLGEQASSQVGKINALGQLGEYDQADKIGAWASAILEESGLQIKSAGLTLNLGVMHARRGADRKALDYLMRAGELYLGLGEEGRMGWLWSRLNEAYVLKNLGEFEQAINYSSTAAAELLEMGHTISAARAQQMLALTLLAKGELNRALQLLDETWDAFYADGRTRDAMLVELFITDCLLRLRRFEEVLPRCQKILDQFVDVGSKRIVGLALIDQAVALAGLGEAVEAEKSFMAAMTVFNEDGNTSLLTQTMLEYGHFLTGQDEFARARLILQECLVSSVEEGLLIEQAQCLLATAEVEIGLHDLEHAGIHLKHALAMCEELNLPELLHQAHFLLGKLRWENGDLPKALEGYSKSIESLERIRGSLMVEHRVSFLRDREQVFLEGCQLSLELDLPARALEFVERAKSRSLTEMIASHVNLRLDPRSKSDEALVERIKLQHAERDRLYRRWSVDIKISEDSWNFSKETRSDLHARVIELEREITDLWHRLLVHNQEYANEAALWLPEIIDPRPFLAQDTVLVEYIVSPQVSCAFVINRDAIHAVRLPVTLPQIQQAVRGLQLNLRAAPGTPEAYIADLTQNCQRQLHSLYRTLCSPIEDLVGDARRIIFVPHGPLHAVPLHCLFNDGEYLIQRHTISYLPASSLLAHMQTRTTSNQRALVVGHSFRGRLPNAIIEAEIVASALGVEPLLEEAATKERVLEGIASAGVIHIAAHGEFHHGNPLFSGLALEDGSLTTLDLFNTRLPGSQVTLSACDTGRHVLGAGDELFGLMRALLYAGASAVVLSLWPVEDRATGEFMHKLYSERQKGVAPSNALHALQGSWSEGGEVSGMIVNRHPYYWAPFFSVGCSV